MKTGVSLDFFPFFLMENFSYSSLTSKSYAYGVSGGDIFLGNINIGSGRHLNIHFFWFFLGLWSRNAIISVNLCIPSPI